MVTAKKTIKVFGLILLFVLTFLGILLGIFAYRLNKGAVSLSFISDYLDEIVDIDGFDFSIGKSRLRILRNRKFPVQFVISDINIRTKNKIPTEAHINEAIVDYAWEDITSFNFHPGIVNIVGVDLKTIDSEKKENEDSFDILYMAREFFSLRKLTLEKFRIRNLKYENYSENNLLNYTVHADTTSFEKLNSSVFEFRNSLRLSTRKKPAEIGMTTETLYNIKDGTALLKIRYKNVNPSQLASSLADMAEVLKNLNSKTQGEVSIRLDGLSDRDMDIHTLVSDLHIKIWGDKGEYRLGKDIFKFDDISLMLHGGRSLGKIVIEKGVLNHGNAKATVTAEITGISEFLKTGDRKKIYMAFHAKSKDLPFNQLPDYWPSVISPSVKEWIKEHMKGGTIPYAEFDLCYRGTNDDSFVEPDIVRGNADVHNTTVTYLQGMPAVTNASGLVKVNLDRVDIVINKGNTRDLDVMSGIISFYDFDKAVAHADLNLKLKGNVKDALQITDSEPLGYITMMGVNPDLSDGKADFTLKLKFPLREDLNIRDVDVDIKGKSTDFSLDLGDVKLTNGIIDFDISSERAVLKGDAKLNGATSKIDTVINFKEKADFYQQHKIDVWHITEDLKRFLNSISEIKDPKGLLKSNAIITYINENKGDVELLLDLTNVGFDVPIMGIKKNIGKKANLMIVANFENKKIIGDVDFAYRSSSSLITGKARFSKKSELEWVDFSQIKTLKTDAKATLTFDKDKRPNIKVYGKELNISHFINEEKSGDNKKIPDFRLKAEISKLWISSHGYISQLYLLADRKNGKFKKIDLAAVTDESHNPKNISLVYDKKKLNGKIGSIGGLLKAVTSNSPIGLGELTINGNGDFSGKVKGEIVINKFIVKDISLAGKILMMASISGLTSMTPTGIEFDKASLPFEYKDGNITFTEGLVSNLSLGVTVKGNVNILTKEINVTGAVFPVYWANSMLGHIPLIGMLFGGEKNGGLFGINYYVKGIYPNAELDTNPLSLLAPGVVRSLVKDVADGADNNNPEKISVKK